MQLGGAGVGWRRVHRRTSWQVSHGRLLSLVDVWKKHVLVADVWTPREAERGRDAESGHANTEGWGRGSCRLCLQLEKNVAAAPAAAFPSQAAAYKAASTPRSLIPLSTCLLPMNPSTPSPVPVRRGSARSPPAVARTARTAMDGLLGVSSPRAGPPSPATSAAGVTQRTPWRAVAAVSAVAAAAAIALGASTASLWRSPPAPAVACGGGPAAVRQVEPPREVLGHDLDCAGGNYSATALKLVTELPVVRLLSNRPTGTGGGGRDGSGGGGGPGGAVQL